MSLLHTCNLEDGLRDNSSSEAVRPQTTTTTITTTATSSLSPSVLLVQQSHIPSSRSSYGDISNRDKLISIGGKSCPESSSSAPIFRVEEDEDVRRGQKSDFRRTFSQDNRTETTEAIPTTMPFEGGTTNACFNNNNNSVGTTTRTLPIISSSSICDEESASRCRQDNNLAMMKQKQNSVFPIRKISLKAADSITDDGYDYYDNDDDDNDFNLTTNKTSAPLIPTFTVTINPLEDDEMTFVPGEEFEAGLHRNSIGSASSLTMEEDHNCLNVGGVNRDLLSIRRVSDISHIHELRQVEGMEHINSEFYEISRQSNPDAISLDSIHKTILRRCQNKYVPPLRSSARHKCFVVVTCGFTVVGIVFGFWYKNFGPGREH